MIVIYQPFINFCCLTFVDMIEAAFYLLIRDCNCEFRLVELI